VQGGFQFFLRDAADLASNLPKNIYSVSRRRAGLLHAMNGYNMASMPKLNVQSFPRPPLVERTPKHIQIKWHGELIADCPAGLAYWVLETHHPPSASP
jgi:hypothetical protein